MKLSPNFVYDRNTKVEIEFDPNMPTKKTVTDPSDDSCGTESLSLSDEDLSSSSLHKEEDLSEEQPVTSTDAVPNIVSLSASEDTMSSSLSQGEGEQYFSTTTVKRPTKSVRFCEEANLYYKGMQDLSDAECTRCWYGRSAKTYFRENSAKAAREAFVQKPSLLASWFQIPEPLQYNDDAHLLLHVLDTCTKFQKCQQRALPGAIIEFYQRHEDVVGLEHFIVTPVRGEPEGLCRFMLEQARFSIRQTDDNESFGTVLAHVSRCISQPSCLLARELAKAQARALLEAR